jgi:hypothetical protein
MRNDRHPLIIWLIPLLMWTVNVTAAEADNPLSGDIRALKEDIIHLQQDLATLEKELLFPDNTRLNVFLSLDKPGDFTLESVELLIGDQVVASHIYKPFELDALRTGAIQPLYQGNLVNGRHRMTARMLGRPASGSPARHVKPLEIDKKARALFVELRIAAPDNSSEPVIQVTTWD